MKLLKTIIIFLFLLYIIYNYLKNNYNHPIIIKSDPPKNNQVDVDIPKPTNVSQKLSKGKIIPLDQYNFDKNEEPLEIIRSKDINGPILSKPEYLKQDSAA